MTGNEGEPEPLACGGPAWRVGGVEMRNFGMDGAIRTRLGLGAAAVAMVWMGCMASAVPARAFDDRPSTFDPLLNVVGLGKDNEDKPDIDFRERPKLVVPKSNDLPPPAAGGSGRAANWPQDQEVVRRRAAAAAERAPRVISPNTNPILDHDELMRGRSNEAETSPELCPVRNGGIPDCSALTPTEKLKKVFSLGSNENKDVVKPGAEPTREYLTEPPPGYRKATTETQYKNSGPVRSYEAPSAGDYARGVDPNKVSNDN